MRTPYPFREHIICLLPAILVLCGIHLFLGPEEEVYRHFTAVRARHPAFTMYVAVFTNAALFLFYPVYAFFLARGLRGRKRDDILFALCCFAAQIGIVLILGRMVKIAVGRPRPMTGGPFKPFSFGGGYQSFPSGHTGEIIGSSMPFLWRYPVSRYALPLGFGLIIAGVGFSRIYLGMHHPTDVWGGIVLGSLSGYASWVLYGFLQTRWRNLLPEKIAARTRPGNKELGS